MTLYLSQQWGTLVHPFYDLSQKTVRTIDIKNHEIINDKIDVRDGLHLMKVYKRLPLKKYLAAVVTKEDVCLEKEESFWTPKTFAAKANMEFERLLGKRQCLT